MNVTTVLTKDQLERLKRGLDLIGDVQAEMAVADKEQNDEWRRLYSILCDLGREFYRLKNLCEVQP